MKLFQAKIKWQPRFADATQEFQEHRLELHYAIGSHTAIMVGEIHTGQREMIAMMKAIFERPTNASSDERAIMQVIKDLGGRDTVWADDSKLKEVIEKSRVLESRNMSKHAKGDEAK